MIENNLTDIFTEPDESIFDEGSIDPMGLRMIWTSLGNKIFGNKLNTISTDIRFYTLNLFHHYVICRAEEEFADRIIGLTGREPYNTKNDLRDGLIIFLESLLVHTFDLIRSESDPDNLMNVPGSLKFRGYKIYDSNNRNVKYLTVDRKQGILVRHILLGIHGRYKGPFQQMQIFGDRDYYVNSQIWNEAAKLFSVSPWNALADELLDIIKDRVLIKGRSISKAIQVKADELMSNSLIEKYRHIKNPAIYRRKELVEFWESRLGLRTGTAGILYASLKQADPSASFEKIIRDALKLADDSESKILEAVCAIEPFLACMDKMFRRINKRGTTQIDTDLIGFADHWLTSNSISTERISEFLSGEYLDEQALLRLKVLLTVYSECKSKNDSKLFIYKIIEYHNNIMKARGKFPWISIGIKGNITLHRSTLYGDEEYKTMKNVTWVNSYYLPTLESLYSGLHKLL